LLWIRRLGEGGRGPGRMGVTKNEIKPVSIAVGFSEFLPSNSHIIPVSCQEIVEITESSKGVGADFPAVQG